MIFHDFLRYIETETGPAFRLFGREIRIENPIELSWVDTRSVILNSKIDIEIFLSAIDRDFALLFSRSLDAVDDDILDGALNLNGIADERAWVLANTSLNIDTALRRHTVGTFYDFAYDL